MTHLLGTHVPTSGGVSSAFRNALAMGCAAFQVFTRNPNQWKSKPLEEADIAQFRALTDETGIVPAMSHDSYLINLATPKGDLRHLSLAAFQDEIERAAALGIPCVVTHMGAHMGEGEEAGLARLIESLDRTCAATENCPVKILLETTAGQGTYLGYRFEHLACVLAGVSDPARIGACLDTCHIYAAGYDIATREGYESVMEAFGQTVGFERLCAFHINDSQKPLASHADRHAHLGEGTLGLEPFRWLVNDPRFFHLPKILETPQMETRGKENLDRLKGLVQ
ncbi:MAG: deoxyribonuclease IV [Armatimonadetes bacterium]|nr:deoxyribonuclease IV [Armatimonadota bacterium]